MLLQLLAAAAGTADPPGPGALPRRQLLRAGRHRLPRRPGRLRDRGDPAIPGSTRHRSQHQPPRPLIQLRQQQLKLRPHTPDKIRVRAHQHILPPDTPKTQVKKGRVPSWGCGPQPQNGSPHTTSRTRGTRKVDLMTDTADTMNSLRSEKSFRDNGLQVAFGEGGPADG